MANQGEDYGAKLELWSPIITNKTDPTNPANAARTRLGGTPPRTPTNSIPAARQVDEVQNSPALVSRAPTPRRTEDFPVLIGRVVTRRFTISSTRCWDGVASRPTTRRRPSTMWIISSSALLASMISMPPAPGSPTGFTTRSTRSRSSGPNEFDSACPLRRPNVLRGSNTRQATTPISRVGSSSDPGRIDGVGTSRDRISWAVSRKGNQNDKISARQENQVIAARPPGLHQRVTRPIRTPATPERMANRAMVHGTQRRALSRICREAGTTSGGG